MNGFKGEDFTVAQGTNGWICVGQLVSGDTVPLYYAEKGIGKSR